MIQIERYGFKAYASAAGSGPVVGWSGCRLAKLNHLKEGVSVLRGELDRKI